MGGVLSIQQCRPLRNLRQDYAEENAGIARTASLWHIQVPIVFTFRKSILAREAGPSGPTGSAHFSKAIKSLPDSHRLRREPILSIEILSIVALFMQALNMRRATYFYVYVAYHFLVLASEADTVFRSDKHDAPGLHRG